MTYKYEIRKIVRGDKQNRITVPKDWPDDYAAVYPVRLPDIDFLKSRRKNVKK